MGLFDKIKDNAKTISMKAIEATREYDEDYTDVEKAVGTNSTTPSASTASAASSSASPTTTIAPEPDTIIPTEDQMSYEDTEPANTPVADKPEDEDEVEPKPEEPKPVARKSKVTEVPKKDIEEAEKLKKQEKAKQAAKERLAKSYTPSYKKSEAGSNKKIAVEDKTDSSNKKPSPVTAPKRAAIVDIATGKPQDNVKQAVYARERAALNALSSQRRLNGTVPLYTTSHMNFKTRVYIDRVEYSGSFGKSSLPIEQVSWVKLRYDGTGVIIETTEGKRVVMVVKKSDRLAFADAVLKVQSLQPKKGKFKDNKTVRIDQLEKFGQGVDEIEKLAKLFDKGIITQEEFDAKKKQILGL